MTNTIGFYAIIHVPRAEHPALVERIRRWLKPQGAFLALWPLTDWEGTQPDWEGWGSPMWWSHFDGPTNLAMVRAAGFTISWAETLTSHGETWLWVLAQA